jgi:putative effector of murein hydrolase LrgA (UPF0299 family)
MVGGFKVGEAMNRLIYFVVAGFIMGTIIILAALSLGYICQTAINIAPNEKTEGFLGAICWAFV